MRILTAQDVKAAITMKEAIDAVREGFIALSTGKAHVPLRSVLQTSRGTMLYMPAFAEGSPASSVKIVGVFPENRQHGLPVVSANVFVLDAQTGQPRALMSGTYLTALRTGAASGLATDLLARPDAAILGVIGAGAQARTQIEAICAVRPIREIRVYSRHGAAQFVAEMTPMYPKVTIRTAATTTEALKGADVLVAATTSRTPVIQAEDISLGAHINGVGSYTHEMQEVAADVVTQSKIVVDSRESALAEAGDLIIPMKLGKLRAESIHAELGEIAAGLKQGRASETEITFFKSVGNAIQDLMVATRIIATAEARNLGTLVDL